MGQKLHVFVRKVNHIPRIIRRSSVHLLLGWAGSYLGPHGWGKSFHWSSADPFMEAATGKPWIPLASWPHCKKSLESEIYENLPMLEEAFQQNEVENDKNLVICQKSADTQKHYKVCQKLLLLRWKKRFIILFLQAYIASIMKFLEKLPALIWG